MCGCLCYDIKGVYLKTWPSDIDILLFHVKFDRFAHSFEFRAKNTAKRNMSSKVCALSMYSRLCLKMSSFLFVRTWAMPGILYLSCGIPFPVWTPGIISGLTSVMVWLSR